MTTAPGATVVATEMAGPARVVMHFLVHFQVLIEDRTMMMFPMMPSG